MTMYTKFKNKLIVTLSIAFAMLSSVAFAQPTGVTLSAPANVCKGFTLSFTTQIQNADAKSHEFYYTIDSLGVIINRVLTLPNPSVGPLNATVGFTEPGSYTVTLDSIRVDTATSGGPIYGNFSTVYSGVTLPSAVNGVILADLDATILATDDEVCNNDQHTLTIEVVGGTTGETVDVTVSNGAGYTETKTGVLVGGTVQFTRTESVLNKTTFTYTITNIEYTGGLCTQVNVASEDVVVNPTPQATLALTGSGTNICLGNDGLYNVILSGEGQVTAVVRTENGSDFTYSLNGGGSFLNQIYTPVSITDDSIYVVSVVSETPGALCTNASPTSSLKFSVNSKPSAQVSVNPSSIVAGSSAQLQFDVSGPAGVGENIRVDYSDGAANYILDDGDGDNFVDPASSPFITTVSPPSTTTYTVTKVTDQTTGCFANLTSDVTLTVLAGVDASTGGNFTVCAGDDLNAFFSFANPALQPFTVILTEKSNPTLEIQLSGVQDGVAKTIVGSSFPSTPGLYEYELKEIRWTAGGVQSSTNVTGSIFIQVISSKSIELFTDSTICEGTAGPVGFKLTGPGDFTIKFKNTTNSSPVVTFNATEFDSPSTQFIPANFLDIDVNNITLQSVTNNVGSCPVNIINNQIKLTVVETPVAQLVFNPAAICAGDPVDLVLQSTNPASTYDVTFRIDSNSVSTTKTVSGLLNNAIVESYTPSTDITITTTKVEYTGTPKCSNATNQQVVLDVTEKGTISLLSAAQEICSGDDGKLTVSTTGVLPVSFIITDGAISTPYTLASSNDTTIFVSPSATATYILFSATDGKGCSLNTTGSTSITVGKPIVLTSLTNDLDTVCSGSPVTFSFTVTGDFPLTVHYKENGVSKTFNLLQGSLNKSFSPTINTTFVFDSITDGTANKCALNVGITKSIIVRSIPTADLVATKTVICDGESVQLRIQLFGDAGQEITYVLSDQNGTQLFTATEFPGSYFITVTPLLTLNNSIRVSSIQYKSGTSVCVANDVDQVNITRLEKLDADISITPLEVCEGTNLDVTISNISGNGNRTVYFKNDRGQNSFVTVPNGVTTATQSISTGAETGFLKYYITKIVSQNGSQICENLTFDDTVTVKVNKIPTVTITSSNNPRCTNGTPTLITFEIEGNGPYTLVYNDGNVDQTITITADSDFDGKLDRTISVSPGQTTTYTVKSISDNSSPTCVRTSSNSITVNVLAEPEVELLNDKLVVCENGDVLLRFDARGKAPFTVDFNATSGAPVISFTRTLAAKGITTVNIGPLAPENYTFQLTNVTDGNAPAACTSTGSGFAQVTVNDNPEIASVSPLDAAICTGESTELQFVFTSIENGGETYEVSYTANGILKKDTIVSNAFTVTPTATTNYNIVSLKNLITGCTSNVSGGGFATTITVVPLPTGSLSVAPTNICEGSTIDLTFTVSPSIPLSSFPITAYYKQQNGTLVTATIPNDGTPYSQTITVTPVTAGTTQSYYVLNRYEDASAASCTGTINDTAYFTLNPTPTASFTAPVSNQTICLGDTVQLKFAVAGAGQLFAKIRATNGTGSTEFEISGTEAQSPLVFFAGPTETTTYELIAVRSLNGSDCPGFVSGVPITLTVKPKPQVVITSDNGLSSVCPGDNVELTFTFSGINPGENFDFDWYFNGDRNEELNFPNPAGNPAVTRFVTVEDTSLVYVDYIKTRGTPQCINTDSVPLIINTFPAFGAKIYSAFDSVFCQGEQEGFMLDISSEVGEIVTVTYIASGIPAQTYSNSPGTYFVPVTAPSTGVYNFIITDVRVGSTPACQGTFEGVGVVTVYPDPKATLSGVSTICAGGTSSYSIALQGTSNDTIIAYYSDNFGNAYEYRNRPGTWGILASPSDTTIYTLDSVRYKNFDCVSTINVTGSAQINVRPTPDVTVTANKITSCVGQDIQYAFQFNGDDEFDIAIRITQGTGVRLATTLDRVVSGDTYTLTNALDSITFEAVTVTYSDIPSCSAFNLDTAIVQVYDSLNVALTDTICNGINTNFQLEYTITGGIIPSYTYNSVGTIPTDLTEVFDNGLYNFTIADTSGCPSVVVSGMYQCDCVSFAGTMQPQASPIELCKFDTAFALSYYDNNPIFDANDTLAFVLHDASGFVLGTVFQKTGDQGKFGFDANTMVIDQVYYISPVVGDASLSEIYDATDRCLNVGAGIPVKWIAASGLTIDILGNNTGSVCEGDLLNYTFTFDGVGPFQLQWSENGTFRSVPGDAILSFPTPGTYTVQGLNPVTSPNNTIQIVNGNDNGFVANACPLQFIPSNTVSFDIKPLPDVNYTVSDITACTDVPVTFSVDVPDANTTYRFVTDYQTDTINGPSVSYSYAAGGVYQTTLIAKTQFGCTDTKSPGIVVNVTQPEKPTISVSSDSPIANVLCRQADVTFTTAVAGLSGDVSWFRRNAAGVKVLIKSGAANDPTNHTLVQSYADTGSYKIIVEYLTNGCTSTDSILIDVVGPYGTPFIDFATPCAGEQFTLDITGRSNVESVTWDVTGNGNGPVSVTGAPTTFEMPSNLVDILGSTVDFNCTISSPEGCVITTTETRQLFKTEATINHRYDDYDAVSIDDVTHCFGLIDTLWSTTADDDIVLYSWSLGGSATYTTGAPVTSVSLLDPSVDDYTYDAAGTYKVVLDVEDARGCKNTSFINITVDPLPNMAVVGQDSICTGLEVYDYSVSNVVQATWNPIGVGLTELGSAGNNISFDISNDFEGAYLYSIDGVDANGCRNTISYTVTLIELDDPNNNPDFRNIDTLYTIGYELPIDFGFDETDFNFDWAPPVDISCINCGTPTITTLEDRLYRVNVEDIYGCFGISQRDVNIKIRRESSIDMPDAFTPNGDGVNDLIYPDGWAIKEITVFEVYNRWGELVHTGKGPKMDAAWDGTKNGTPQVSDIYSYKVIATTILNTTEAATGSFRLVR